MRRSRINAVVDSGIFIARAFAEEASLQCEGLLNQLDQAHVVLHAPVLFQYELVAVCRKVVFQKRTSAVVARLQLENLLNIIVTLHLDTPLLKRAYELAEEYNLPTTYDSQYLAVAEQLSCEFWTLDERLFRAVNRSFPNIRWVGNWQPEA